MAKRILIFVLVLWFLCVANARDKKPTKGKKHYSKDTMIMIVLQHAPVQIRILSCFIYDGIPPLFDEEFLLSILKEMDNEGNTKNMSNQ